MPSPPPPKKKKRPGPGEPPDSQAPGGPPGPGASPPAPIAPAFDPMAMMPGMMPSGPMAPAGPMALGPPPLDAKPGQGTDAARAMTQGLGPDPLASSAPRLQGPPLGPGGLPVGATLPGGEPDADDRGGLAALLGAGNSANDMGGSDLLKALVAAASTQGDPYGVGPMQPGQGFEGMGPSDPNLGIEQLLQLLALGKMGVGGNKPSAAGSSGLDVGPFDIGGTVGL